MKLLHSRMLTVILAMSCLLNGAAQTKGKPSYDTYFHTAELPDSRVYLPAPADTASVAFVDDFMQWVWGKSVRNTARGKQASDESLYGVERLATVFGEALNIEITKEMTPAMWRLIHRVGESGNKATNLAKAKYMRRRPFMVMNETTWGAYDTEEDLRPNGSYPSGHTGFGWASALAMTEVAPAFQDTILRRGYQYGESRVIVGAHWQSDVDAGYLAASACWARLHTSKEYMKDLKEARAEFQRVKEQQMSRAVRGKKVPYPNIDRIINMPTDSDTHRTYGDMIAYWNGKEWRDTTERGLQALADTACTEESFMKMYSACVGMELSEEKTPQVAALIKRVFADLCVVCGQAKSTTFRQRPFARMGESSGVPALNDHYQESSSFPSSHSLLGWGLALSLVEVMPEYQNELLTRGFEYGESRTLLGFHYKSDVQAGRVMASAALARMNVDEGFQEMMEKARKEISKLKTKK